MYLFIFIFIYLFIIILKLSWFCLIGKPFLCLCDYTKTLHWNNDIYRIIIEGHKYSRISVTRLCISTVGTFYKVHYSNHSLKSFCLTRKVYVSPRRQILELLPWEGNCHCRLLLRTRVQPIRHFVDVTWLHPVRKLKSEIFLYIEWVIFYIVWKFYHEHMNILFWLLICLFSPE